MAIRSDMFLAELKTVATQFGFHGEFQDSLKILHKMYLFLGKKIPSIFLTRFLKYSLSQNTDVYPLIIYFSRVNV